MAIPLVMLGPGGDYVTRFEVKGRDLLRNVGQPESWQDETQARKGFSREGQTPRRDQPQTSRHAAPPLSPLTLDSRRRGPIARPADGFEHNVSQAPSTNYHPHAAAVPS